MWPAFVDRLPRSVLSYVRILVPKTKDHHLPRTDSIPLRVATGMDVMKLCSKKIMK